MIRNCRFIESFSDDRCPALTSSPGLLCLALQCRDLRRSVVLYPAIWCPAFRCLTFRCPDLWCPYSSMSCPRLSCPAFTCRPVFCPPVPCLLLYCLPCLVLLYLAILCPALLQYVLLCPLVFAFKCVLSVYPPPPSVYIHIWSIFEHEIVLNIISPLFRPDQFYLFSDSFSLFRLSGNGSKLAL
jgi:hypothetical protein